MHDEACIYTTEGVCFSCERSRCLALVNVYNTSVQLSMTCMPNPTLREACKSDMGPVRGLGLVVIATVVHLILCYSVIDIHFQSPVIEGITPVWPTTKPHAKRIVLVVADGASAICHTRVNRLNTALADPHFASGIPPSDPDTCHVALYTQQV